MDVPHGRLIEQIQRIGSAFDTLKKGPVFQHHGVGLYSSEIHMMKAVASNPECNATSIAKILGVTKGAVSQMLGKLERKGVCKREHEPGGRNELRIELTPFGRAALQGFHKDIADDWRGFGEFLDDLSHEERRVVSKFLTMLEGFLKSLS